MTASTETLDCVTDSVSQALPYHSNTSTLRNDSPKRDATEMYLKSKALLESKRECTYCSYTDRQRRPSTPMLSYSIHSSVMYASV